MLAWKFPCFTRQLFNFTTKKPKTEDFSVSGLSHFLTFCQTSPLSIPISDMVSFSIPDFHCPDRYRCDRYSPVVYLWLFHTWWIPVQIPALYLPLGSLIKHPIEKNGETFAKISVNCCEAEEWGRGRNLQHSSFLYDPFFSPCYLFRTFHFSFQRFKIKE